MEKECNHEWEEITEYSDKTGKSILERCKNCKKERQSRWDEEGELIGRIMFKKNTMMWESRGETHLKIIPEIIANPPQLTERGKKELKEFIRVCSGEE